MCKTFEVVLTIFLLAAPLLSANDITGDWTGIVRFDAKSSPLQAHFDYDGKALSGTVSIPFEGVAGAAIVSLQKPDDTPTPSPAGKEPGPVAFEVKLEAGALRFEGKLDPNGISGQAIRGETRGSFELARLVKVTPAKYFGIFQFAPDHCVYIRTWDELGDNQLTFFDDSGRVGALNASSETEFFSGPALWLPLPREIRAKFQQQGGQMTGLEWNAGSDATTGRRLTNFHEENIKFASGSFHLAGTLLTPAGPGQHPAVVLVHGSGPVTRDFMGPLPYLLVHHGFAVLSYDKRGIGESDGHWLDAGLEELAADALAGVAFLKSRKEIDASRIGLLGISQGGWIVPLATSLSDDVAFAVLISAASVTPAQQIVSSMEQEMIVAGAPEDQIHKQTADTKEQLASLRSEDARKDLAAEMSKLEKEGKQAQLFTRGLDNPKYLLWLAKVMDYDPLPALQKMHCPVLALYGELDRLVPVAENKANLEAALRKGSQDVTVKVIPQTDHALLLTKQGSSQEFPFENRFAPEFFFTLTEWLDKQKK